MLKFRNSVVPQVLLALSLVQISAAQQPEPQPVAKIDAGSQASVDALRAVTRAISECPEGLGSEIRWGPGPLEFNQWSSGPPIDVVWDVVPSRSARAPYLGYVEFFTHVGLRFPQETEAKYDRKFPGLRLKATAELSRNWKYRYEYDVGPEGLKLVRALFAGFGGTGDSCWDKAARNPPAQETPAAASNSSQESTSAPTAGQDYGVVDSFALWHIMDPRQKEAFLWGFTNGLFAGRFSPLQVCMAEKLSTAQRIALIDKYFAEHSQTWRAPAGGEIVSALTAKGSPCEGKGLLP